MACMPRPISAAMAYPRGTGCCNDGEGVDKVYPVLYVEATNWALGKKDGYQQRAKTKAFPDGTIFGIT